MNGKVKSIDSLCEIFIQDVLGCLGGVLISRLIYVTTKNSNRLSKLLHSIYFYDL